MHSPRAASNRLETDDSITLVNCPFHALAREYTDLVCGMNLDLMSGMVDALDEAALEPRLEPADGRCCVRLHARP
jgi:predicted ArsR family transcriptional regulator